MSGVSAKIRARLGPAWRRLRGGELTRGRAMASVALGLFVGSLPLWGLHFPLILAACLLFRLDFVVAYLAAQISNPLFVPFLIGAEVEVGSLLLTGQRAHYDPERTKLSEAASILAVGAPVVGAALALVGAALAGLLVRRGPSELDAAVTRTIARYRSAPRATRGYVAGKLRHDPILGELARLGRLGDVVDVGAGRGQLSLALYELGHTGSVVGFDADTGKVAVAQRAAEASARFFVGPAESTPIEPADCVLLVDVLHYLDPAAQHALLVRSAAALRPGGRLIVREASPGGWSGWLTRTAERFGVWLGVNRGQQLHFAEPAAIESELVALGLQCQRADLGQGTPLSNRLLVARRAAE